LVGQDPPMMEKVTENLLKISDSVSTITDRLKKGEGTIGKLLTEDKIYNELDSFLGGLSGFSETLNSKKGTIGRLFTEDKIYRDLEEFVADLKAHPWKLLSRGRD